MFDKVGCDSGMERTPKFKFHEVNFVRVKNYISNNKMYYSPENKYTLGILLR